MSHQTVVCVPVLNLYAQPDDTSEVISQALYGWTISVLEKHENFQSIQTRDGYQGWVENKGLGGLCVLQEKSKKLKTIYPAVPVYSHPHVKNKPLWILPFEVELAVVAEPIEEEGRWIQVQLLDKKLGWIQRGHVSFDFSVLALAQMLKLSHQFMNVPYIWGGTSSFGYDCSGFIQMLERQRGIILPRDASQQIQDTRCQLIEWENLEAGDLLFYGSSAEKIQHVALYLGQQNLIHASVKPIPIVQKTILEEPSLGQRFTYRTARRLKTAG